MSTKTTVTHDELDEFIEEEYKFYCELRDSYCTDIVLLCSIENSFPHFPLRYEKESLDEC